MWWPDFTLPPINLWNAPPSPEEIKMILKAQIGAKVTYVGEVSPVGTIVNIVGDNYSVTWGNDSMVFTYKGSELVPYTPPMKKASDTQIGGTHYKNLNPEPWDVMEGWNKEHFIGFLRYSALKRLGRWDSKDSALQDIKKAHQELGKLIELLEEDK